MAQSVGAAAWTGPITVTNYPKYSTGLTALDDDVVVAADGWGAVRRSADGGLTWGKWKQLADRSGDNGALYTDITGRGSSVDVVWEQYTAGTLGSGRVSYARSTDGGVTYSSPRTISSDIYLYSLQVARGPGGVVAVIWIEDDSDNAADIVMRVSTNGGATFGPRRVVWNHVDAFEVSAAVGDGVIHAGFVQPYSGGNYTGNSVPGLHVRRSVDQGGTWNKSARIGGAPGTYCGPFIDMTAEGERAFVGFTTRSRPGYHPACVPAYRGTSDKGQTWDIRGRLTWPSWGGAGPVMSLDHGVVRAIYTRCKGSFDCEPSLFYKQSVDGMDWSTRRD
jgi:hypothetical protein